MDVSKMKVAELKNELKDRGLNTAGNKQELLARLQEAIETEVIGQDLLADDDVVDDLNEEVDGVEVGAKEEEEVLEPKQQEKPPVKKIILNRRIEFPTENEAPKEETKVESPDTKKSAEATLSAAERLALRAKRFGSSGQEATATPAPEAKKAKVEPAVATPEQLEVLKRRAERFGAIVAPAVEAADIADRKKQRQERFSTASAAAPVEATPAEVVAPLDGPAAAPPSADVKAMTLEERKRMRAERFK